MGIHYFINMRFLKEFRLDSFCMCHQFWHSDMWFEKIKNWKIRWQQLFKLNEMFWKKWQIGKSKFKIMDHDSWLPRRGQGEVGSVFFCAGFPLAGFRPNSEIVENFKNLCLFYMRRKWRLQTNFDGVGLVMKFYNYFSRKRSESNHDES